MFGKLVDFDIMLIFRLLRMICNFIEFCIGWNDLLNSIDYIFEVELVRIKYYCNFVYGYN